MEQTSEQLHERGPPPLSDKQRKILTRESKVFGFAGLTLMGLAALDYCAVLMDHAPTRSENILHGAVEACGIFAVIGVAAEFTRAAASKTAAFEDLRNTVLGNSKKFAAAALFTVGVGCAQAHVEHSRAENKMRAQSAEAQTLPKMDCDKKLYTSADTTPRHFAEGRDKFIFQDHLVDCTTPTPKGFQPHPNPIPVGLIVTPAAAAGP